MTPDPRGRSLRRAQQVQVLIHRAPRPPRHQNHRRRITRDRVVVIWQRGLDCGGSWDRLAAGN